MRYRFLAALLALMMSMSSTAAPLRPRDVDALPTSTPDAIVRYGADALQFGELRLPPGPGPFPIAVVIHGGCWTKGFATLRNTAPIASALTARGIATWNVEYRQGGDAGGGWPGTYRDWGDAVDALRDLGKRYPIDLDRVVSVGHSAGAHAALWVAARHRLREGSEVGHREPLPIRAAFAIDGPGDLEEFAGTDVAICGRPVVAAMMGGTPAEQPERYGDASPYRLLPLGIPQFLVGSAVLTPARATTYMVQANRLGDRAEVLVMRAGHFEVIAPDTSEWAAVEAFIVGNLPR